MIIVDGIATDYCVKACVIDALNLGYSVVVVEDLIRGVTPVTSAAAIAEMKAAGAVFIPSVYALPQPKAKSKLQEIIQSHGPAN